MCAARQGEVECSCALDTAGAGAFLCHKSEQKLSPLRNFERMGLLGEKLAAGAPPAPCAPR